MSGGREGGREENDSEWEGKTKERSESKWTGREGKTETRKEENW
jgi:hypothetical protein